MSHEVETMMYTGEVPWHGLGVELDHVATAAEAIAAAKMDWEVELQPVFIQDAEKSKSQKKKIFAPVDGKRAVVRLTDSKVYNIVSDSYVPVQNQEAFAFFDQVVGNGDAKYHTAGSLRGGAIIWVLAKLDSGNGSLSIAGEEVEKHLVLTNSHNGWKALQMYFTPIRVVCMNTLSMSLANKSSATFYARHTTNIGNRIETAKEILGLAQTFYANWKEQADYLAVKQLSAGERPLLLKAAFNVPLDMDIDEFNKRYGITTKEMVKVNELFTTGKGMDNPAIQGTAWQGYNAVAEYVDYHRDTSGKGNRGKGWDSANDLRLHGAWFGSGADIKARAWDYALTY